MSVQTKEKVQLSNLCDLLFPGYYSLLNDNNFILESQFLKNIIIQL